jgi:hypothetical protein
VNQFTFEYPGSFPKKFVLIKVCLQITFAPSGSIPIAVIMVPREFLIFKFLPDTMLGSELRHGETWLRLLKKRNKELQSFSNLSVIFPVGNDVVNIASLSNALQHLESADLDLGEAMSFICKATQVKTSSVLDDLEQSRHRLSMSVSAEFVPAFPAGSHDRLVKYLEYWNVNKQIRVINTFV